MISLLTDNQNNDLYLDERGNLASGEDKAAVAQICKNVLRACLGELPLNQSAGIPYLEDIFVSNASLGLARAYMMRAIAGVNGVNKIMEFEIARRGDVLGYQAKILTQAGVIEING